MSSESLEIVQWAGIALGSVLLLAVAWVWLHKQVFGLSGATISLIGMVLVGLTLWKSISFEYDGEGIRVRLDRLEAEVARTTTELAVANTELDRVQTQNAELSAELLKLDTVARANVALNQNVMNFLQSSGYEGPAIEVPDLQIDRGRLQDMARERAVLDGT